MERIKGIIKSATDPKEFSGRLQIGFTLKENPEKWYNISGTEDALKLLRETSIKKGNEIEFETDVDNKVSNLKLIAEAKNEGFDDDIVNFETLLNVAHNLKENFEIKTEMLTIDLEKKYALFKAQVIVTPNIKEDFEKVFEGHGDATSENVTGEFIKPHFIRMAETRAICRALRWYTNNATCSEEEKSTPN